MVSVKQIQTMESHALLWRPETPQRISSYQFNHVNGDQVYTNAEHGLFSPSDLSWANKLFALSYLGEE